MYRDEKLMESHLLTFSHFAREMNRAEWHEETALIVREKAVTIYVNFEELTTIICSPWQLIHMAVGFLCSEGILRRPQDLKNITVDEDKGLVYAEIDRYESNVTGKVYLKRYITPCCGRRRAFFYDSAEALFCKTVESDLKISGETVKILAEKLEEKSWLFSQTGGVHNAALAKDSEIIIFQEDVGRHNTLDKI